MAQKCRRPRIARLIAAADLGRKLRGQIGELRTQPLQPLVVEFQVADHAQQTAERFIPNQALGGRRLAAGLDQHLFQPHRFATERVGQGATVVDHMILNGLQT